VGAALSFHESGNRSGSYFEEKKKGYDFNRNPLILLVAGTGFEPVTFGL
jgi:hypothetical protein